MRRKRKEVDVEFFVLWLSLTAANVTYAAFMSQANRPEAWETAAERSVFQGLAILLCALFVVHQ